MIIEGEITACLYAGEKFKMMQRVELPEWCAGVGGFVNILFIVKESGG